MIKILEGSKEEIQVEMKQAVKKYREEIKELKKRAKDKGLTVEYRRSLQNKITALEDSTEFIYSPSRVLPVRLGRIIINLKVLDSFLKKIKGFKTTVTLTTNRLIVGYSVGDVGGSLELNDLSDWYKDFRSIPVGVLYEGD